MSFVARLLDEKFMEFWPKIEHQLEFVPHIWADWWTLEAIRDLTLGGRFQCWAVVDGEGVTGIAFSQIAMYPAGNVFQVFLAFGEGMSESAGEFEAACEQFAREHNCGMAEVTGRPGWEAKLKGMGFKRKSVTLTKHINESRTQ